jgi:hypothetical protein
VLLKLVGRVSTYLQSFLLCFGFSLGSANLSWGCYDADICCFVYFIALMQLDMGNARSPAAKASIIVAAQVVVGQSSPSIVSSFNLI